MKWLAVCLLAGVAASQTTFRADVRLVGVSVAVRDDRGRLIGDLTQDDFEVFDDGVPQKLSFFAHSSDVPLSLGLLVDISGSQGAFVRAHQRDLKTFLDKVLSQRDRAFLVCFAAHPRLIADYTSSGRQLVDALEGYMGTGHKGLYPIARPARAGSRRDIVLRCDLSRVEPDVSKRRARPQGADRLQRRRGQFQRPSHDGDGRAGAGERRAAVPDPLYGDAQRPVDQPEQIRPGRHGADRDRDRGADFDAGEKELAAHFHEIGEQLRSSYELAYHSGAEDRTFASRGRGSGRGSVAKTGTMRGRRERDRHRDRLRVT